jgi:hypothetical protein
VVDLPAHSRRGLEIDIIRKRRALIREVNQHIRGANGTLAPSFSSYLMLCECERSECFHRVEVSAQLYDQVRSDSERFLVIAGHEDPDVERVVAGDDYSIVRARGATEIVALPSEHARGDSRESAGA